MSKGPRHLLPKARKCRVLNCLMRHRNPTGYCPAHAHRIAAWLEGMVESPSAPTSARDKTHVLHKCDNRKCCRPSHFFLGNFSDNQKDAHKKGRKAQPRGEQHSNAKLTNAQAARIRKQYIAGEFQVPLAKKFGVTQTVISKILRGETYK